jgi:hypothetical protein
VRQRLGRIGRAPASGTWAEERVHDQGERRVAVQRRRGGRWQPDVLAGRDVRQQGVRVGPERTQELGDQPAGEVAADVGPVVAGVDRRGPVPAQEGRLVRVVDQADVTAATPQPQTRFQPRDEGERARYAAYALYRRAAEAVTVRAFADHLLDGADLGSGVGGAGGDGSDEGAVGAGVRRRLVVVGDLNDEPKAATTQILLGPPGSELGTPARAGRTKVTHPGCGTWPHCWTRRPVPASTAADRNSSTTSSSAEARHYKPSTVSRRVSVVAGFYRTTVIDGLLDHSPAEHVRRPRVPPESPTLGLNHLQFEALLTAARTSANRNDFALVALRGLLGLRIFEATGLDISDLREEHGHRVLRVTGKGGRITLVPLPPEERDLELGIGAVELRPGLEESHDVERRGRQRPAPVASYCAAAAQRPASAASTLL